jgi:hypothetical protein
MAAIPTIRPGSRIRLIAMVDDPDPIPAGATGTVLAVTEGPYAQIDVAWDDHHRSLSLIPGIDRFDVIDPIDNP